MTPKSIAKKIVKGEFQYIFGRFKTVRRAYSRSRGILDVFNGKPGFSPEPSTLFPDADVDKVVENIRREAVHIGFQLPAHLTEEIRAFAIAQPLHPGNDPHAAEFHYHDIQRGHTASGRRLPLGGIKDPVRCAAIRRVVHDPKLLSITRAYLGYIPRRALTILHWSFASDFTDEERRRLKHHVIDYHYDVGGLNFVYANFYIVDTDSRSGAHMMMKRSHDRKPLRMLLGSAVASEADVRREYGADNEILIEGPAGTGFIQDASCFHRATPPTHRDRLMLAIRYS